ncbi:MAG: TPR end-of-group domain-containing protein [Saprospiraceae bacterium]
MPKQEFDEKYNAKYLEFEQIKQDPKESLFDYYKSLGINKYRELDFAGAAQSFLESIEKFGESPQVHFNLACCYSMLNDAEMTYLHLEKAVANGLDNIEKIHDHKALAFIRQDEKFNSFVKNNYKRPFDDVPNEKTENEPEEEKLDLYGSLLKLGDLKEKGIINEEEFNLQKKKILDTL